MLVRTLGRRRLAAALLATTAASHAAASDATPPPTPAPPAVLVPVAPAAPCPDCQLPGCTSCKPGIGSRIKGRVTDGLNRLKPGGHGQEVCATKIFPHSDKHYIKQYCGPVIAPGTCYGYFPTHWRRWEESCGWPTGPDHASPPPGLTDAAADPLVTPAVPAAPRSSDTLPPKPAAPGIELPRPTPMPMGGEVTPPAPPKKPATEAPKPMTEQIPPPMPKPLPDPGKGLPPAPEVRFTIPPVPIGEPISLPIPGRQ